MNTAHERKSGEVARAKMKLGFDDERVGVVRSCGMSSLANQRNLTKEASSQTDPGEGRGNTSLCQVRDEITTRSGWAAVDATGLSKVEGAWPSRVTSVAGQSARSSAERVGHDPWSVRDLPPAGQEVAVDATELPTRCETGG